MLSIQIFIFLSITGFNLILCRPDLKFDEAGNVLTNSEFKNENEHLNFMKLVASKVKGTGT